MKKWIKVIGNFLVVAALIFLVKKCMDMHIAFDQFYAPPVLAALGISFVVQTCLIVINTFPWLVFTESLSGKRIPFSQAMPVFTRSNLYKYVPGNVFQYVGRNQLAADCQISHADVAFATVLDIGFCVLAAGVCSVLLLGSSLSSLWEQYGQKLLLTGCIALGIAAVILALVCVKFRDRLRNTLSRYAAIFQKKNFSKFMVGVLYYFLQYAVSAAMYLAVLHLILGSEADLPALLMLTGAFLFAWIVGFVTIGAPGGIGVRESVMMMVCSAAFEQQVLLFVLVIRIASILADVGAFLIGAASLRIQKKNAEHQSE